MFKSRYEKALPSTGISTVLRLCGMRCAQHVVNDSPEQYIQFSGLYVVGQWDIS